MTTTLPPASALPSLRPSMSGIVWMLAAGLGFVMMDSTAKFLTSDYSTVQITWCRYLFHMLTALPILLVWRGRSVFHTRRLDLQLIRSVLLLGSTVFYFIALRYIPLATAASIYAIAFAKVKASSWIAVDPASRMWYPLIEMAFHSGISCPAQAKMSVISLIAGRGG